jgi:hypothetical protein
MSLTQTCICLDKCIDWRFIPCMDNPKLFKYTDQPHYPHDMTIAELFSDVILIIKLPGIVKR